MLSGSSPRTRGTDVAVVGNQRRDRFIPAHAGNSTHKSTPNSPATVHPRARGEQTRTAIARPRCAGSSPRTRGTVDAGSTGGADHRFIPAHAGNRAAASRRCHRSAVHPRARGEQETSLNSRSLISGSSPRTRGTEPGRPESSGGRRFIPAHAGNRLAPRLNRSLPSVHPRARGEQQVGREGVEHDAGSSPRTRGTAASQPFWPGISRFIPAHAGNRSTCGART